MDREDGTDCDFCAIACGEHSDSEIVCEADRWLAFFPLKPATPGHTLIIPRAHYADLWATDASTAGELMAACVHVGRAIQTVLEPEGMNLITSSGSAAEQTVFHVHLHLVPRWSDDGFGRIWPPERAASRQSKSDLASRIRSVCSQG